MPHGVVNAGSTHDNYIKKKMIGNRSMVQNRPTTQRRRPLVADGLYTTDQLHMGGTWVATLDG